MDVNSQLLGITAIPRLPKRFGIPVEFPGQRTFSGITRGNFERTRSEACDCRKPSTARTNAQKAHLQMFQCKMKYDKGEMNHLGEGELLQMFQKAGNRKIESKKLDHSLSVAPPLFCLDHHVSSLNESERDEARKMDEKAINNTIEWSDASPPARLDEAIKLYG